MSSVKDVVMCFEAYLCIAAELLAGNSYVQNVMIRYTTCMLSQNKEIDLPYWPL